VAATVVSCLDVKLKLDLLPKNKACDKWNKVIPLPLIGPILKAILDILFPRNCESVPIDCSDVLQKNPNATSGVYMIGIGPNKKQVQVYCNMTSGGGWTVFQRRKDGSVDFRKTWNEYEQGFGTPEGEFWLGNENLAMMTASAAYKLRVDFIFYDYYIFGEYDSFKIGGASDKYNLTVGEYTGGDAGDGFLHTRGHASGVKFTTIDQPNNACGCAELLSGAWWYACCTNSNLNGLYGSETNVGENQGIWWLSNKYLSFTEMKISRV